MADSNRGAVIKGIVDRLVALEDEKQTFVDDIKDVLTEAKENHQLSPKALRAIVKRKRETAEQKAKRKVDEDVLDEYLAAMGFLD